MQDGFYKVSLEGGGVKGFMIGTMSEGHLTGCDQTHHVTGNLQFDGSRLSGRLTMTRHAKPEYFVEIANMDVIEVNFSGICGANCGEFNARIEGRPDLPVKACFQRLCGF